MKSELGGRVVTRDIFHRIGGSNHLGDACLALGRPHGQARQKPAIAVAQVTKGLGDITSVLCQRSMSSGSLFSGVRAGSHVVNSRNASITASWVVDIFASVASLNHESKWQRKQMLEKDVASRGGGLASFGVM